MHVDGVTNMQQRIAQISAQLAALSANANRPVPSSSATTATSGPTSSSTAGTTAGSSSFGSALADAMSVRTTGATGTGPAATGGTVPDPSAAGAALDNPVLSTLTASTLTASTLTTNPLSANPLTSALVPQRPAATTSAVTSAYGTAPAAGPAPAAAAPRTAAPDLSSFGNGRIPAALLEPIGVGDHRLAAPAADGFRAMVSAARRDGVRIGVNDSYRSYEEQVDMARRKGLYSQGGLAAQPGTSDHGWGRSVDLQLDTRALSWMRTHADEYGFSANVPRESWHWTFRAGK